MASMKPSLDMVLHSQSPTSNPLSMINDIFGLTVIFRPIFALIPGTKDTESSFMVIYPPKPIRVVNSMVPNLNMAVFIWNIGDRLMKLSPSPKVRFTPQDVPIPKSSVKRWSQERSKPDEYVAEK